MKRALVAALVLVGLYVAFGVVLRVRHPPPSFAPAQGGVIAGAVHVHTDRSHDGRGTLHEIAEAARATGLGFIVLADHNVAAPAPAYVRGVLVVPGAELSTPHGHLLAVGPWPGGQPGRSIVAQVHAVGARAVISHPFQRKRPWTGWDAETDWDAMEIVSVDTLWRAALHRPLLLARAALAYPFAPERALAELWERDAPALERWERERAVRPVAGLCSVDAHGLPEHRRIFSVLATYVEAALTGDAASDTARVTRALFSGRSWCALRVLGDVWTRPAAREVPGRLRGLLWGEREVPWVYASE